MISLFLWEMSYVSVMMSPLMCDKNETMSLIYDVCKRFHGY